MNYIYRQDGNLLGIHKNKRKRDNINYLIEAIKRWPDLIHDSRHGYSIYVEVGKARREQVWFNTLTSSR